MRDANFSFLSKDKERIRYKKLALQFLLKLVITVPVCNKSWVWLGKMCVWRAVRYKIMLDANR